MAMKWLLLALALLLGACGGASSVSVAVYGDSLTSGGSLSVTPTRRMQQMLGAGFVLADYSAPSMRASDALAFPFAAHIAAIHPDAALILYGGADVIGLTDPAQFEADMRALVALAQSAGARVVLATVIRHPLYEQRIAPINDAIRRIAADTGAALADVYALPTGGFTDGIHPDQAYADARAAVLVASILNK